MNSLTDGRTTGILPIEDCQVVALSGNKKNSEIFYQIESFLTPGNIYKYDFSVPDIEASLFREENINLDDFDKKNFLVEQVLYPSLDGTNIPMYIVQKKSAKKGTKPCLLYGYGGFAAPVLPAFSFSQFFFMNVFNGVVGSYISNTTLKSIDPKN